MSERLTLDGGRWIDIKTRLKVKDTRQKNEYSVDGMSSDGKTLRLNAMRWAIAEAAVRVIAWHGFKDDTDALVAYPSGKSFDERVAAIDALDENEFEVLSKAISERFEKKADAVPEKNELTAIS